MLLKQMKWSVEENNEGKETDFKASTILFAHLCGGEDKNDQDKMIKMGRRMEWSGKGRARDQRRWWCIWIEEMSNEVNGMSWTDYLTVKGRRMKWSKAGLKMRMMRSKGKKGARKVWSEKEL